MKVWMYEFEESRKGDCNKWEVFKLQLAGKVDLRSEANISGVCWRILLIFWNFDWNGETFFFSESMKVIEASLEKLGEIGFFSNNSGVCCPILLKF